MSMNTPDLDRRLQILERQLRDSQLEIERTKERSKNRLIRLAAIACSALFVIGLVYVVIQVVGAASDPVPASVRQGAHFDIYIPRQSNLPSGFTLDTKSFSLQDQGQAAVYSISAPQGSRLVVSAQRKLSVAALSLFYKTRMPLTIPIVTPVGTAELGVLNNETVISLPTNTNAWVLMTAPLNFSQVQLKQVLQSLTRAQ